MFKIIDHTADVGIYAEEKGKEELFLEVARGMVSIIKGESICSSKASSVKRSIKVQASNLEELLVFYLNEILYWIEKKEKVWEPISITIKENNYYLLKGEIKRVNILPQREIKSATYHNLLIKRERDIWKTTVIFDV